MQSYEIIYSSGFIVHPCCSPAAAVAEVQLKRFKQERNSAASGTTALISIAERIMARIDVRWPAPARKVEP
jgi:hypothetical protein